MKITMTMDLKDVKNMGCDHELCNNKIQVLDFTLIGTRMFTKRFCNRHYKGGIK